MSDEREGLPKTSPERPEFLSRLSGADAIRLLEIIHRCLSSNTEEDFIGLFPKIRELFAFEFAGALLGDHDDRSGLVLAQGFNINFPADWLREYLSHNYFYSDVATKETFRTYELKHWSYLTAPNVKANVPKKIMSLNMDIGAREGYFHGSPPSAPGKNGSAFCFAGPLIRQDGRTAAILEVIVPHLHLALVHIFEGKPSNINGKVLSTREKEVLDWLKLGKSSWDMSVILGISESTVNYHVYNIMRKLEASNRAQAVAVAARLGLIDIG